MPSLFFKNVLSLFSIKRRNPGSCEDRSVVRVDPEAKKISTVVADKALEWPDTMCWRPDDSLYVSASQIENSPRFNNGRDIRTEPYRIFKWTVPALPGSGTN